MPADEFFQGVYMTAVGEGELLTKVSVPPSKGAGDGFAGLTIGKHGTYVVNAAATRLGRRRADRDRLRRGDPGRATAMEEQLAGGDLSEDAVRAAAEGLGASLDPPGDVHGSADYRRHLAEVSAVRAVLQAASRRKGASGGEPAASRAIGVEINGERYEREVPARRLLVHFLRDDLGLTGTHVGCDTGNCGACTVPSTASP